MMIWKRERERERGGQGRRSQVHGRKMVRNGLMQMYFDTQGQMSGSGMLPRAVTWPIILTKAEGIGL